MAKPVRTTPQADLHILELDAWWRANSDKAPDLFEQELSMAFRTISSAPHVGKRYPHPEVAVYRVLLRSTRHHVYYVSVTTTSSSSPSGVRSKARGPISWIWVPSAPRAEDGLAEVHGNRTG